MLIQFMNGKVTIGNVKAGAVVYHEEAQMYGHINSFTRNAGFNELILIVLFDDGTIGTCHPANLKFMDLEAMETETAVLSKESAQAILDFQKSVNAAVDKLLDTLQGPEKMWANLFYAGRIQNQANGKGMGAAPVAKAADLLAR